MNIGNLFLAQQVQVNTVAGLMVILGHALGLIVAISYVVAVTMLIMALKQDRGDGSYKHGITRALVIMGATAIVNIFAVMFFPQFTMTISFA